MISFSAKPGDGVVPRWIARHRSADRQAGLASSREPPPVTVRSMVESRSPAFARQRAHQFQVGAGRRIDEHARAGAFAHRRVERRPFAELGLFDIGENAGGCRKFRPGETGRTRRASRRRNNAPGGRRPSPCRTARGTGDSARRSCSISSARARGRAAGCRRRSARAGRPGQDRRQAAGDRFRHLEGAGGNVDPGKP
jgi:hypothetical protein